MLNDRDNYPNAQEASADVPTLADICSGDADFDFTMVGRLYVAAREAVASESDQHTLEEHRNQILDTLASYLQSCSNDIAGALSDEELSASQAQRGSRIIAQMYEQYGEIQKWPEEFGHLLSSYRDVAHQGIEALNNRIVEVGDSLREEFAAVVQIFWTHLGSLREETNLEKRTEGAHELSQAIAVYVHGAADIEAVCAWRLGKAIRSQFRKIGRYLDAEFSVKTELPEVPMDIVGRITAGNRIPLNWPE